MSMGVDLLMGVDEEIPWVTRLGLYPARLETDGIQPA